MTNTHPNARRPTYTYVLRGIKKFRARPPTALTTAHHKTLEEVERLFRRLDNDLGQLLHINEKLVADDVAVTMDPTTGTATVTWEGKSSRYTIPGLKGGKIVQSAFISAYHAGGSEQPYRGSGEPLRMQMEGLLENYYYQAHRVLKLVQTLPGLKKFKCHEITMVRNKLVEHPNKTTGEFPNSEPYSFGYGTNGPFIRPFHRPGREWQDAGLMPNTKAFITALLKAFPA